LASLLVALSSFVPPPAEVPPASPLPVSPVSLELPPLAGASPDSLEASLEGSDEPVVEVALAVVDVVDVAVLCTAAFSALVSVGGVMSGVLFGTASLTLPPPPQALRPTEHSSTMLAAIAARADGRRDGWWGSSAGRAGHCATASFARAGGVLISGPQDLN
jgi:hypothetical protein